MKKILLLLVLGIYYTTLIAQEDTSIKTYRAEKTKIHDLVHTKLKVSFDFQKRQLNGEAWITAKPHFYATQKITLDAKSMQIHEVKLKAEKLDYNYQDDELIIDLGNAYAKGEEFEIYIKYTANPEDVDQQSSAVISDAKGLYFIDPDGTDPNRPTQIWTQGATESSSCWFPTIDSPNQKTTQEIYMRVPSKYTTLSNGLLISQTNEPGAMRTDYWKMTKPHAPYLFFMGVGEFSVVKDQWKGKPVHYYVEKEYEEEAREIFGNTPEMIQFFSDKFNVDFPWEKYSQIVGRDFVSGAMENTTATIHGERAYQKMGQLADENIWEDVVAHELVHQWFGDLVTTESWSNITVNESFATYGEYLWREFKYGKDHADAHLYEDRNDYVSGDFENRHLVRFYYEYREDIFDAVSYQKGANILHMLRNYLGDKAFFAGLTHYLTQYQFDTAEAHQLRIAMEQVSGKDLNSFFNQWYFDSGHPKLYVSYDYNDSYKTVTVTIKQSDKVFSFPLDIAIYESGTVANHQVNVSQKEQSFTFQYNNKPSLVNINAKHVLLCEIIDDQKTLDNYIFQYNNVPHFVDRKNAIAYLAKNQNDKDAFTTLNKALNDPYYELRIQALQSIDLVGKYQKKSAIKSIEKLATTDSKSKVQGVAIGVLGKLLDEKYLPVFEKGIHSESYTVKGNATLALYELDKQKALQAMGDFDTDTKEYLSGLLTHIYLKEDDKTQMPYIAKNLLDRMFVSNRTSEQEKDFMKVFEWISSSNNSEAIQNLTYDLVSKGKRYKKYGIDQMALGLMRKMIELQEQTEHTNKEAHILVVKKGMAELLE